MAAGGLRLSPGTRKFRPALFCPLTKGFSFMALKLSRVLLTRGRI